MRSVILVAFALLAFGLIAGACKSSTSTPGPTSNLYANSPTVSGVSTSVGETPTEGASVGSFADKCQKSDQKQFSAPEQIIDTSKTYTATITLAKGGDIVLELFSDTPVTTNDFVFLACKGFYDGLTFHRVIPDFVIQGGDPTGIGDGGPGYTVPNEDDGTHKMVKGVISMAKSSDSTGQTILDSTGSQFFVTIGLGSGGSLAYLDPDFTVFGNVTSGEDVASQVQQSDKINTITIEEK